MRLENGGADPEFWVPDTRYSGRTVVVIGGGPSLRGFDFERLRGFHCIAVNSAGYDVPWADILLFHDNSWFCANRGLVDGFAGEIVTFSRHAKAAMPALKRLEALERAAFPIGAAPIRIGRCSGQSAVSLAVTMGARRIALFGFDMRPVDGQTHYHVDRALYTIEHAEYSKRHYHQLFLPAWAGWSADAAAVGCEIVNATPGSALTEFPMVVEQEALR